MNLVTSPLARIAVIAALVAAFGLTCWLRGAAHAERRFEALRAKEEAAALGRVVELAKAASDIDAITMNITTTVRQRARVVTKEVPVYVTREADARCTVPRGFVSVWNADLQADPAPAAADRGHDEPAGLALSDVARDGVIPAKERFGLNQLSLIACQNWIRQVTNQK